MNLEEIRERLAQFASARNWDQFHTPKNLSMALAAEAAELLEIFQWLTDEQSRDIVHNEKEMAQIRQEIADVFIYLVRLADKLNVDIEKAVFDKIELNEKKYPVELSRGNAIKYNKRSSIRELSVESSSSINRLWRSEKEDDWKSALDNYGHLVERDHRAIEEEFKILSSSKIQKMNPEEWYEFLLNKYFYWKYTAPNRYVTTTVQLKKYKAAPDGLEELFIIKQRLFDFDKEDLEGGLRIASSVKGLGTAGAAGLLAVLFPTHFGTVDQFAVKALGAIDDLPEKKLLLNMNPDQLKIKDAVVLIKIMKDKADELNKKFTASFWTPRKIDMILWSVGR